MSVPKLVLIDANSLIHRAFHALPPLTTSEGNPIAAVYGFTTMLLKVLDDLAPTYAMAVWDTPKPTFRHTQYEKYKRQRPPTDPNLVAQFEPAHEVVESLNIPQYAQEGFEADDLIGSIAKQVSQKEDVNVLIVTGDLDDLQLVDDQISVFTTRKGFSDTVIYNEKKVAERYGGLKPAQLIEYKGLAGDASDNIPGVKGIGEKTAIDLVSQYKNLDEIFKHLDLLKPRQAKLLSEGKEDAFMSRELGTIITSVPVQINLEDARVTNFDSQKAINTFNKYGFKSLIGRIAKLQLPNEFTPSPQVNVITPNITRIQDVLKADSIPWEEMPQEPIDLFPIAVSVNVLTGLTQNELSWEPLIDRYLGLKVDSFTELSQPQQQALSFALRTVIDKELNGLGNEEVKKIVETIEIPLRTILQKMSEQGILVDRRLLTSLHQEYTEKLSSTEKEIYRLVGYEFNLNSPKQLQEVLFDQLNLPVIKKTKTQRSTDESVLNHLKGLHPVIELLLQYRTNFKIKSTYLEPLLESTTEDQRVHTTFQQTHTASGRLSSVNPNMQNVPIDDEVGLRQVFTAAEGKKLIIADYSQIELRIMAHYSKDDNLINSFTHEQDIHTATAARIFSKLAGEITSKERKIAKTINFALMYGMSAHGLSESLGIEIYEAKHYIDNFFASYPKVKEWQAKLLNDARAQGYVQTLFGRRRSVPELLSSNFHVRSAGERAAINHPLQGTQADILKMAMIEIDKQLKRFSDKQYQMLLQVHDELVFEVDEKEVGIFSKMVKDTMENITRLDVPLRVEIEVGDNWRDTEIIEV